MTNELDANAPAPRVISCIICDVIRREDSGKQLLVGVYTDGIMMPSLPFPVPMLCAYVSMLLDCTQEHKYQIGIEDPDGEVITIRGGTLHAMNIGVQVIMYPIVHIFQPFEFKQTGMHSVFVELDGGDRMHLHPLNIQSHANAQSETRH